MSNGSPYERKELVLPPNVRLDKFLAQELKTTLSRAKIQALIKEGRVESADGEALRKAEIVGEPLKIVAHLPIQQPFELISNNQGVPILYQDEYFAIIHKPSNMTVHPGAKTKNDTLVHSLITQLSDLSEGSDPDRPGIVHRLDRGTEGLMIIAKTNKSHERFSNLFKQKEIKKEYCAWIYRLLPSAGEINGFITRHPKNRKLMLFSKEKLNDSSKVSELSYQVEEQINQFSLVRIHLKTGRTHQIRASFSYLSAPVVGDKSYGYNDADLKIRYLKSKTSKLGTLLCAAHLSFIHPFDKSERSFSLELPDRFQEFKAAISN